MYRIKKGLGNCRLILVFCSLILTITCFKASAQQEDYQVLDRWLAHTDASNALYHFLSDIAYQQLDHRRDILEHLQSKQDWKQRQAFIRETLDKIVGPFPDKTPLNAQVLSKIEKEGYMVENIIFESQPKFYVTASLFIPKGLKNPGPAILDVIGHSPASYRRDIYQHEILNLVRKGFIVLAIDPIGQGERLQYYDVDSGKSLIGSSTHEHSYSSVQAFLAGSSQAKYVIWDGIRAIDYLLTRPEVDSSRIGVTGLSGGGTLSSYLGAFDDRIDAAAPSNYITSYKRLIESIGPQDGEQNFYRGIESGLDHGDLLMARAPKPTLMITTSRDFFSIQGSKETEREVKRAFDAYGQESNFKRVEDDHGHGFTKKNNESMYAFFQKYLDHPGDSTDIEISALPQEELQVTKTGQVTSSFKDNETVFSLNKKEALKEIEHLNAFRQNESSHLEKMVKAAKSLSGYVTPLKYQRPVFTGRYQKGAYNIEKYFVKGEGDYVIPYLLMVPLQTNGKVVISLHPKGKVEEIGEKRTQELIQEGYTILIPDLLGIGELGNGKFKGDAYIDNVSYGVWFLGVLTGRSIVGIQAADISRLVKVIQQELGINEIYGYAKGALTAPMIYAATFNENIENVVLEAPLISYRSMVMNEFYDAHFVYSTVAASLKAYDLPDLMASLAPRKLTLLNPVDAMNKPLDNENQEDLKIIKNAFGQIGEENRLHLMINDSIENYAPYFEE